MRYEVILLSLITIFAQAITVDSVQKAIDSQQQNLFSYPLGIKIIPAYQRDAGITICCHGYGSSCEIGAVVHSFKAISDHLVSFNFPDYDCIRRKLKVHQTAFGSIDEILPLLYVIKVCVIDAGINTINLYGFSAGGGAIINILATLNQPAHDAALKKIGIDSEHKKKIIAALEKGIIVLDCPLKSMDELLEVRGNDSDIIVLAQRYRDNNMRPIDAINMLAGFKINYSGPLSSAG